MSGARPKFRRAKTGRGHGGRGGPPPGSAPKCAQARVVRWHAAREDEEGWPASCSTRRYERHCPEQTTLYAVVRDNLETLYGAIDDGALDVKVSKHARQELEAYLDCGLLCRGFARLRCGSCSESRLVAFSCKGRGFCPSCLGRQMCATAANLIEHVLPEVALRQWGLTFPFAWRRRLSHDGALLRALTRIFVDFCALRRRRSSPLCAVHRRLPTVALADEAGQHLRQPSLRLPNHA